MLPGIASLHDNLDNLLPKLVRGSETPVKLRIQCSPKPLESHIVSYLKKHQEEYSLEPQDFDYILFFVHAGGVLYSGVGDSSWNTQSIGSHQAGKNAKLKNGTSQATCRAFFKLESALNRLSVSALGSIAGCIGVDCGASPGGWTQCLVEHAKCRRVFSIDPAKLPYASRSDKVTHLQMKAEEALDLIEKQLGEEKIGIWVSDMNVNPAVVVRILKDFKTRNVLKKNCQVVISFKRFDNRNENISWKDICERNLAELAKVANEIPRVFHLMSNGKDERTVIFNL
eukprot:g91.t1